MRRNRDPNVKYNKTLGQFKQYRQLCESGTSRSTVKCPY